jgi:hypothetical protein
MNAASGGTMLRAVRIAMLTAATALACTAARAGAATPNDTYVSYLEIAREPENAEALPAPQPVPAEPQPTDWIDWNGENFFSPCSGDCSISLSGGRQIRTSMTRIVTLQKPAWEWNWGHSELLAGAFSRRLVTFWNALNIEPEFGVAKRLGDMQAVEFWGAVTVRWTAFPWNDYIKTTIAFSDGFSLATQVDTVERNANVNHAGSILLNYFTPEITFALPDYDKYEMFFGVHHRSGIWGVINNVNAGTQFGMVGLRVHF